MSDRAVRLVCIDVDGTLVGSTHDVPAAVWPAAERARARGIRLAICSGRPAFGNTRGWAERLDPAGWHVFQNGASVLHLATGRSLSARLDEGTVRELVQRARATGRVLELYGDAGYVVESTSERARQHAGLLGVGFEARAFERFEGQSVVRAQWGRRGSAQPARHVVGVTIHADL